MGPHVGRQIVANLPLGKRVEVGDGRHQFLLMWKLETTYLLSPIKVMNSTSPVWHWF